MRKMQIRCDMLKLAFVTTLLFYSLNVFACNREYLPMEQETISAGRYLEVNPSPIQALEILEAIGDDKIGVPSSAGTVTVTKLISSESYKNYLSLERNDGAGPVYKAIGHTDEIIQELREGNIVHTARTYLILNSETGEFVPLFSIKSK